MGRLLYGATQSVEIEDRPLAHLQVLISHKLRRSEPFMLDILAADSTGHRVLWIHPAVALQFQFFGNRNPHINRGWVDQLIREASRPHAVMLHAEPPEHLESSPRGEHVTGFAAGHPLSSV